MGGSDRCAPCAPAPGPSFLPLLCCQGDKRVFTFPGVSQMGWEPGARAEGTGIWLSGGCFTPSFLCGPAPFAGVPRGSNFLEGTGPGTRRRGVEAGSILSLSPSGSGAGDLGSAGAAICGCKLGCEERRAGSGLVACQLWDLRQVTSPLSAFSSSLKWEQASYLAGFL